jgi:hypothetical protein
MASVPGDQTPRQDDPNAYTTARDNWRGVITVLALVTALNDDDNHPVLKPTVSSKAHHPPLLSNDNPLQLVMHAVTSLSDRDVEVTAVSTQLQGLSLSVLTTGESSDSEAEYFLESRPEEYQTKMGKTSTGGFTSLKNPDLKDRHFVGEAETFVKLLRAGVPHFDELVTSGDSYFVRE